MKNIFNPVYRQDYFEGYSNGLDPYRKIDYRNNTEAFNSGFNSGRLDYENMNGCVMVGIPSRIVTKNELEEFLLSGMLGLSVDIDGYTPHQLNTLAKWYQSGTEKYDPGQSDYLLEILEENGIKVH
jgi:hypothetical protein